MLLTTSQLIKKYGLDAKRSLGQNFILDKNVTDKIAKSAGNLSEFEVLEIGPGPGGLTRSILDAGAKKLTVIEKDERCLAALAELKETYGDRLEIINADALEIDEKTALGNSGKNFRQFGHEANAAATQRKRVSGVCRVTVTHIQGLQIRKLVAARFAPAFGTAVQRPVVHDGKLAICRRVHVEFDDIGCCVEG